MFVVMNGVIHGWWGSLIRGNSTRRLMTTIWVMNLGSGGNMCRLKSKHPPTMCGAQNDFFSEAWHFHGYDLVAFRGKDLHTFKQLQTFCKERSFGDAVSIVKDKAHYLGPLATTNFTTVAATY